MRGKGIGSAVIRAAKTFLAGRCDELMVYRGGERTDGYRFYVKSGHRDLLFLRPLTLAEPQRCEANVAVEGLAWIEALQPELLACFEATYGTFGGFPRRHATYWTQQLGSQIYEVLPQQAFVVRHPASGPLAAYALAGRRTREDQRDHLSILEVAGFGEGAIEQALLGLQDLAAREGASVRTLTSAEDPHLPTFRRLGFTEHGRSTMIMGQPLSPAELFAKACADESALDGLRVDFWAPFADGTLYEGVDAARSVALEGKDEVIYRLLNRRLDVAAAVRTEWLTVRGGTPDIVDRLAAAFPYTPWAYHHIDYV